MFSPPCPLFYFSLFIDYDTGPTVPLPIDSGDDLSSDPPAGSADDIVFGRASDQLPGQRKRCPETDWGTAHQEPGK